MTIYVEKSTRKEMTEEAALKLKGTGQVFAYDDGTDLSTIKSDLDKWHSQQTPAETQAATSSAGVDLSGSGSISRPSRRGKTVAQAQKEAMSQLSPEQQDVINNMSGTEKFLVGAGEGLTNVARGLGLADQATPEERESADALRQTSGAAAVGNFVGETAPFIPAGVGVGKAVQGLGLAGRTAAGATLGGAEGNIIARGQGGSGEDIMAGTLLGAAAGGLSDLALAGIARATGKPDASAVVPEDIQKVAQAEKANKDLLESWGYKPTQAEISQDATQLGIQKYYADDEKLRLLNDKNRAMLRSKFEQELPAGEGRIDDAFEGIRTKAMLEDDYVDDIYEQAGEAARAAGNKIEFDNVKAFLENPDNAARIDTNPFLKEMRNLVRGKGGLADPRRGELEQGISNVSAKSDAIQRGQRGIKSLETQTVKAEKARLNERLTELKKERTDIQKIKNDVTKDLNSTLRELEQIRKAVKKPSGESNSALNQRMGELMKRREQLIDRKNDLQIEGRDIDAVNRDIKEVGDRLKNDFKPTNLDTGDVLSRTNRELDELSAEKVNMKGELSSIPRAVEKDVSVMEMKELKKRANEWYNKEPASRGDIRAFKDAIDKDMLQAGGRDFWKQADEQLSLVRESRSPRTGKYNQRETTVVNDIIHGELTPDNAVNKLLRRNSSYVAEDLAVLKNYVGENSNAWQAIKNEATNMIISAAKSVGRVDGYTLKDFDKVLSDIGPRKMKELYSPEEMEMMNTFKEVLRLTDLSTITETAPGLALSNFQKGNVRRIIERGSNLRYIGGVVDSLLGFIENVKRGTDIRKIMQVTDRMEKAVDMAIRAEKAARAKALANTRTGSTLRGAAGATAVSGDQAIDDINSDDRGSL